MKTLKQIIKLVASLMTAMTLSCCYSDFKEDDTRMYSFIIEEDLRSFEPDITKGVFSDLLCKDENGMGEIVLAAYELKTGKYFSSVYLENLSEGNSCRIELREKCAYKVFAMVNMGKIMPPPDIRGMEELIYTINESSDMIDRNGFVPMSGSTTIDTGSGLSSHIYVKRLVAEIRISYNCPKDLKIIPHSIRLCNVPKYAYPFGKAAPGEMGAEGDMASQNDLELFAAGEEIRMFILENTEWPENNEGTLHVQEMDETPPDLASWIELECDIINSVGLVSAKIRYRLLLDFKIERNKRYTINFSVTPEGVFKDSWSVETWDALIDMKEDIVMQSMSSILIQLPIAQYCDVTYSTRDENIIKVVGNRVLAIAPGTAYVNALCRIGKNIARGTKKVTVINRENDQIDVSDKEMLLGTKGDLSFYAATAESIEIETPDGTLTLDASHESNGTVRSAENEYLTLEFDPTQAFTSSRRLKITLKRLPHGNEGAFIGSIRTITGNTAEFVIKASIPELTVNLERNTVCESGTESRYVTTLQHHGTIVTRNDFEPELYDRYYKISTGIILFEDTRHIGIKELSATAGIIYGKEADGRNDYTASVFFKYSSDIGSLQKGYYKAEITVTPAFTGNGGKLNDIHNMILYSSGGFRVSTDIPAEDFTTSDVELRHLDWDRVWEHGNTLQTNESIRHVIVNGKCSLELSPDSCGPYAMRLTKFNQYTGKTFECIYYFDIYLNIEVGIHIPWNESMNYRLDIEIIFNANANNSGKCGVLKKLYEMNPKILTLNKRFGQSGAEVFTVGTRIENWNINDDFFYNDSAHAQLPLCVNFYDSIINQFVNKKFVYRLYNPFTQSDLSGTSFSTDEDAANSHFAGEAVLLKFNLSDKFLFTVTHFGCSWGTGFSDGYTETNRY